MTPPAVRGALAVALLAALGAAAQGRTHGAAPPLFRDVAQESGLRFVHFTGSTGEYFMPEIMGAGGALFDYDGDGDLDVLLLQGTMLDEGKTPAQARFPPAPGQPAGARLFRNDRVREPDGRYRLRFTDVTEKSGLRFLGYGMGVAVGDYDNDGHPDVYITAFGPNALYHNNGDGTFTDVTRAAGVGDPRWSTSATFFDYDGDGDLDLFVANYLDFTIAGNKTCFDSVGARDFCSPSRYRPVPGRLFRNDGGGRFTDVTESSGIAKAFGPGLGVVAGDFDGDGRLDLYVANDGAASQLWLNRGNGAFEEQGLLSGTAFSAEGLPQGSMGIAAGDFDGDGDEDIYVTNLPREGSTLYVNQGQARFQDLTTWPAVSVPAAEAALSRRRAATVAVGGARGGGAGDRPARGQPGGRVRRRRRRRRRRRARDQQQRPCAAAAQPVPTGPLAPGAAARRAGQRRWPGRVGAPRPPRSAHPPAPCPHRRQLSRRQRPARAFRPRVFDSRLRAVRPVAERAPGDVDRLGYRPHAYAQAGNRETMDRQVGT